MPSHIDLFYTKNSTDLLKNQQICDTHQKKVGHLKWKRIFAFQIKNHDRL